MLDCWYEDDISKVYHSKFEDIIDTLKFDYIITDPPYNINYKYSDYKDCMLDDDYVNMLARLNDYKTIMIHYPEEFCGCVSEAMGKPNKCVTWCYNSNLYRQSRMIGWFRCKPNFDRVKQPYKDMNDPRNIKLVAEGHVGCRLYDWWNDISPVKNTAKEKVKSFKNQMPIKLLERIILITTEPNDIICDPFFGTGSLHFACKNTNRRCIGIEQSKQHLEYFKQRLEFK